MTKNGIGLIPILVFIGSILFSCSSDDYAPPVTEEPEFELNIDVKKRTQIDFTITSDDAADYAYVIAEKGSVDAIDAEMLFREGKSGLLEDKSATVSTTDVEGGKVYTLYTAVRKINPYVYSEVNELDLDLNIAYADLVTLDKIGLTDFTYHLEVPDGGATVKHVVVKKADYIAIEEILAAIGGMTRQGYLKVFGHQVTESGDFTLDKYAQNGQGDGIHIYSGSTYYLMAGVVGDDGNIDESQFEFIEFDTRRAVEAPYDFDINIETTSTTASISIVPDPEIVDYRVLVESKEEYDFARREGESQVRSLIIGFWDDSNNRPSRSRKEPVKLYSPAMVPNSEYVLGIVGFDAQNREKVKIVEFVTGQPVGPAPTVAITPASSQVAAPWNSASYNVKVTNTTEVRYGFFIKSQVDNLVANGSSLTDIIKNNGTVASDQQVAAMLKNDGLTFDVTTLQPSTEYLFGVYAVNNEYRTACETAVFKTAELPQAGGSVRANMPGKYMAYTTDENGRQVSFPVTVSTGVNAATTADYSARNRLVAIGFGPADKYPVVLPEQLVNKGESMDDADKNYGPKWFIEFTGNSISVPACAQSWNVGNYNGEPSYMRGYGLRYTANGYRDMEYDDTFPVEVSEDGNTVTVKGVFHDIGNGATCYPAMYQQSGSGWLATTTYLFQCYSDIVMKRVDENKVVSLINVKSKPWRFYEVKVGETSLKASRQAAVNNLRTY